MAGHGRYAGPLYDLAMLQEPPEGLDDAAVLEESVDGVAYRCWIPKALPSEAEAVEGDGLQVKAEMGKSLDPGLVLAPLRASCLYRMEGWWTYEFCFGAAVKQFHVDGQTGTRVSEFVMGRYEGGSSTLLPDLETRQVKQKYVGGTTCDLSGQPRSIEVRYLCNDKPNGITYVGELQEPSTCQYALAIVTPLVCDLLGVRAASKRTVPVVHCNPAALPAE